jgi:hypothetical protein
MKSDGIASDIVFGKHANHSCHTADSGGIRTEMMDDQSIRRSAARRGLADRPRRRTLEKGVHVRRVRRFGSAAPVASRRRADS